MKLNLHSRRPIDIKFTGISSKKVCMMRVLANKLPPLKSPIDLKIINREIVKLFVIQHMRARLSKLVS